MTENRASKIRAAKGFAAPPSSGNKSISIRSTICPKKEKDPIEKPPVLSHARHQPKFSENDERKRQLTAAGME